MTPRTARVPFSTRFRSLPPALLIFWLLAAAAIPVWLQFDSSAWDLRIYGTALKSLKQGHDPYLDATTVQKQHHAAVLANGGVETWSAPPYSYVYSPSTLPALRLLGHLPEGVLVWGYWLVYVAGALSAIAVGILLAETARERLSLLFAAGVAPFFPGLLANGTVLSGNVAYILYGAAFAAAWLGWKRARWWGFYLVVLLAACVKAPLLSLAVIPALSARRQWLPAAGTAVAGLALFVLQPVVWPALFRHYLEAVELQFSLNHDFGCSPAGLFSDLLYRRHLSYSPSSYLFYAGYAVPVFTALVVLSRAYLRGSLTLRQWAPVLLCGVILLNPRIMEYDVAPITVPMALVALRLAWAEARSRLWLTTMAVVWLGMNAASLYSWEWRKMLDGPLLTLLFLAGCRQLWRLSRSGITRRSAEALGLTTATS